MAEPTTLAYLAGMIDGDGYISITRSIRAGKEYYGAQVGIAGTRPEPRYSARGGLMGSRACAAHMERPATGYGCGRLSANTTTMDSPWGLPLNPRCLPALVIACGAMRPTTSADTHAFVQASTCPAGPAASPWRSLMSMNDKLRERARAEADMRDFGIGFLVDGKWVDPSRVQTLSQPTEPVQASGETVVRYFDLTLTKDEAEYIVAFIADESEPDDEVVRLMTGPGHSGYGLYAFHPDYLDEGAVLVKSLPTPEPMKAADEFELRRLLAEEQYTTRQLSRALREFTDGPTFMGEPLIDGKIVSASPAAPVAAKPDGPMTKEWVTNYPGAAAGMLNQMAKMIDELQAAKPEQQAQAVGPREFESGKDMKIRRLESALASKEDECQRIDAHRIAYREAVAKRDAALLACVEIGSSLLKKLRLDAPHLSGKLIGDFDAAITQAQEARK